MNTPAKPAATIIVLRDGQAGPELLMLRRSQKASFFPHAWVFPGGRVDAADAKVRVRGAVDDLSDERIPFAVAAVRECFEEAGVWLGGGQPDADLRDALNARQATLEDAPTLIADLDRLEQWSWWITPEIEPRRYDTLFFNTALREDELRTPVSNDAVETVDNVWLRPEQALAATDFFLAPPTYLTLRELLPFSTAAEAVEAARARAIRPIMPVHSQDEAGRLIIALPGDPLHDVSEPACFARRVVLRDGRWYAEEDAR